MKDEIKKWLEGLLDVVSDLAAHRVGADVKIAQLKSDLDKMFNETDEVSDTEADTIS